MQNNLEYKILSLYEVEIVVMVIILCEPLTLHWHRVKMEELNGIWRKKKCVLLSQFKY